MTYEVPEPILNRPYEAPQAHWRIVEGETPVKVPGRRKAVYFYRDPKARDAAAQSNGPGTQIELRLVNLIRERVNAWREANYPGATRTSLELLSYWRREGRKQQLFFAQLEAVETILFLFEARPDLRQGITVPRDDPPGGGSAFLRYACKMATGSGKTTVMGMLSAWSILNKLADRGDARFSDSVLIVCPNVTIRERLQELDVKRGEASLYRSRDLVPPHLLSQLSRGQVLVTNWHVFERQVMQVGGVSARVSKVGQPELVRETVVIGEKATFARGSRYLTLSQFDAQVAAGQLTVLAEERDADGRLVKATIEATRYKESEAAMVQRVLGRSFGSKKNILVFNDEAHHAYRIQPKVEEDGEQDDVFDDDEAEAYEKEATVWIEGLDRIHARRQINACIDLSATPYFLRSAGGNTNRPFPWVVSDFGLIDAIESGLVKIPQLAVRDGGGAPSPAAFNIWRWVQQQLEAAERGGRRGAVKPEAVLKYAHQHIAMLAADWNREREEWERDNPGGRPPVFIIVCKNTKLAKVIYEWLALDHPPFGIPPAKLPGFKNGEHENTIRVDSKVIAETDIGEAKSDGERWMRLTLDTIGKERWPADGQGRPLCPAGFEELAKKLGKPLHPPGREVRCIVSVGMLTEGWDCNTVTHIIGLRPFMSQLLCEQVVGRALRRASYEVGVDGQFTEEVARVFGVPFEIVPFKANAQAGPGERPIKRHVHPLPERAALEIKFPRIDGYAQQIRNRITADWKSILPLVLDPQRFPPEVQIKAFLPSTAGRMTLEGPGKVEDLSIEAFRKTVRVQEVAFALSRDLTSRLGTSEGSTVPLHALFPQVLAIVQRTLAERVDAPAGTDVRDCILSPYYGILLDKLAQAIHPDAAAGEAPEIPLFEKSRGPGSTSEVDFWTARDVYPIKRSHLNYVVADTKTWEQSAAFQLDVHKRVRSFAKNAGLGFAIPYLFEGVARDYLPDFLVRLEEPAETYLILEVKGFDRAETEKREGAARWVNAVNADGRYGRWRYEVAKSPAEVRKLLDAS